MEKRICKKCSIEKDIVEYYKAGVNWYAGICKECDNKRRKKYYLDNKEYTLKRTKEHREKNIDKVREYDNFRYRRDYKKRNALSKIVSKKHRINNPAYYTAKAAERRASRRNATPTWSDLDRIELLYKEAISMREQTGIKYHIDHIVPLKGKNVCGLHVHYNLQVLPAKENLSKGSKFS